MERIKEQPPGWVFSAYDLIFEFYRGETDESLSYLAKEGAIRRILRGVYDYPIYNEQLKMNEPPDINKVAEALSRKFNWKIYPDNDTVLKNMGLSEFAVSTLNDISSKQVPKNSIYYTNGPSKRYYIGDQCIEFKHISQKETSLMYANTAMVIQAIKAVGKNQITPEFLTKLAGKFTFSEWTQIRDDASNSTGWIYNIIRRLGNR